MLPTLRLYPASFRARNGQFAVDSEPARASRALGQLTELLNPRLTGPEASYKDQIITWQTQVADYESQNGRKFYDNVKPRDSWHRPPRR